MKQIKFKFIPSILDYVFLLEKYSNVISSSNIKESETKDPRKLNKGVSKIVDNYWYLQMDRGLFDLTFRNDTKYVDQFYCGDNVYLFTPFEATYLKQISNKKLFILLLLFLKQHAWNFKTFSIDNLAQSYLNHAISFFPESLPPFLPSENEPTASMETIQSLIENLFVFEPNSTNYQIKYLFGSLVGIMPLQIYPKSQSNKNKIFFRIKEQSELISITWKTQNDMILFGFVIDSLKLPTIELLTKQGNFQNDYEKLPDGSSRIKDGKFKLTTLFSYSCPVSQLNERIQDVFLLYIPGALLDHAPFFNIPSFQYNIFVNLFNNQPVQADLGKTLLERYNIYLVQNVEITDLLANSSSRKNQLKTNLLTYLNSVSIKIFHEINNEMKELSSANDPAIPLYFCSSFNEVYNEYVFMRGRRSRILFKTVSDPSKTQATDVMCLTKQVDSLDLNLINFDQNRLKSLLYSYYKNVALLKL